MHRLEDLEQVFDRGPVRATHSLAGQIAQVLVEHVERQRVDDGLRVVHMIVVGPGWPLLVDELNRAQALVQLNVEIRGEPRNRVDRCTITNRRQFVGYFQDAFFFRLPSTRRSILGQGRRFVHGY